MLPVEPLGMQSRQWQFLGRPREYVDATKETARPLALESTRRQFNTARDVLERLTGTFGEPRRGILLADDVGLGKTTVAALVAWVVAAAGQGRNVRVLAPNEVMQRRWKDELRSHVAPLNRCAAHLEKVHERWIKEGAVGRLTAGSIQVVRHRYASSDNNLACDLLIVDEAHRAKGEETAFSQALMMQRKYAKRVLILTATPFSIDIAELERMLALVDGDDARAQVRAYRRALDRLYGGNATRRPEDAAERLATAAQNAVDALRACVIRHGVADLPREVQAFGVQTEWPMEVGEASLAELELMLRIDRALGLARQAADESGKATNDPRFHVGWRHLDAERRRLEEELQTLEEPARAAVQGHLVAVARLRRDVGAHSKMRAVASAIRPVIEEGEKVLLFCHHHATAQELTVHLAGALGSLDLPRPPQKASWKAAWEEALAPNNGDAEDEGDGELRARFIDWLCSDSVRQQVWAWVTASGADGVPLADALRKAWARRVEARERIAEAASRLYDALTRSRSSRIVLAEGRLPGGRGSTRVMGVCQPTDVEREQMLFVDNQQPDTIIAIFNSPFGPDALVATDRLSEGIDLHRYCRHLVHYELDPSPIRTVQRNGRLRRVGSWAAVLGEPIRHAYPAFRGTRDHRLVQIMKKRVDSFSLLLGGVQTFDVDEVHDWEERWRNEVIAEARARLEQAGIRLHARPGGDVSR